MKLLLYPVLLSIIAGAFILLVPRRLRKFIEYFSLIASISIFLFSVKIFISPAVQGRYLFLDSLSRVIVLGIGFFGALVTMYSSRYMSSYKDIRSYYAYIIWTLGFSILAALSNNIIVLLLAWGFLGLTLYMLINVRGPGAAETAKKTFIIIGASDSLMIMGLGMAWLITGHLTLSTIKITIEGPFTFWTFFLIAIAAFAKAGAMPFHTWIPDTAEDAPIPVSAFLPASLDKLLGIYLLARLVLNMFILNPFSSALLMVIGAVTIIAAVMMALIQHDFRRLLGYHAVSQVGYMVLGLGTGNPIGIAGALFHMLNNAIYKCGLFLSGGNVQQKAGTEDMDSLGGLARAMPITFFSAIIASLSISGVPPFNGFFSKWMVYQGLIEKGRSGGVLWIFCIVAAMFGSSLTLASFIKFIHSIFLGAPKNEPRTANHESRGEVSWLMWGPPLALSILCIVFGIFAYIIPLRYLIIPALPGGLTFIGTWPTLKAALFLFIGLGVGILVYLSGNFKGIRESAPYIGGEECGKDMRFSGTEFYNTIKDIPLLKRIYAKAERKAFDIYDQVRRFIFFFIRIFQYLHNGVLPTYLVWCLLGMMALLFTIVR